MSEQEMMHDNPADEIESEEYEVEALAVEVSTQPIELYKVLKIANAVSGGGEAKFAIAEGYVAVNGELEQRKRCKLYDGDVVEFNQEFYVVIYQPESESSFEMSDAATEYEVGDDSSVFEPVNAQNEHGNDIGSKANKSRSSSGKAAKNKKLDDKKANAKKKSAKKSKNNEKKEPIVRDQNTGRGGISF
ncbi:RNA-binding S4 domain-containing protein [Vibrio tapetis]|uniref:Uncharacterized protein n=1 Tax=Vibrio tapetis subsp. tapetis TaxID=1671868 RepID=A0A2N8ZKD1_9VIBR|nr:RNA-binding S4 domain-containing protein [Vibrio tapetis]SON52365.1 conserved protein of unknown function [Vibrio tapetis subsp. tapetis]